MTSGAACLDDKKKDSRPVTSQSCLLTRRKELNDHLTWRESLKYPYIQTKVTRGVVL